MNLDTRLHGVRLRVSVAATAVSLLGALVGAAIFVAALHETLEQALLSSARQQVATVVAQLQAGRTPAQAAVSGKDDLVIQVVSAGGVLLAGDHPQVTEPIRSTVGSTESVQVAGLADSFAVVAGRAGDGELIVVGVSEEQVSRATRTAVAFSAIAVPLGIALVAIVIWQSIGNALRPVEVMRREAAEISSEHLERRLAVPPGSDEIPLLASTLNSMLDEIDDAHRRQRQFVSDASHELRSPLATMRQLAELAIRHPDSSDVTQLAREVLAEETRMEDLVTALLTLARLDDHTGLARPCDIDLDDSVLRAVGTLRPRFPTISFDVARVSAGQIRADPVMFSPVIANLLQNAARHARARVRVSLQESRSAVVLTVEDDGLGIRPDDRRLVFERFARLDDARDRDSGGVGLGLAIVQKVVQSLNGTVTVDDSSLGGALFAVCLPLPGPVRSPAGNARTFSGYSRENVVRHRC